MSRKKSTPHFVTPETMRKRFEREIKDIERSRKKINGAGKR